MTVTTTRLLGLAAVVEAATGLALIIRPSLVARLLCGESVSGAGAALGRVAGIGLLALGVACWPASGAPSANARVLRAMLVYNLLATLYLGFLGVVGSLVGSLLWPAAVFHAIMTILFARTNPWGGR